MTFITMSEELNYQFLSPLHFSKLCTIPIYTGPVILT